ncbi:putative oxidoreductase [Helianthus annuus]|nr:putative oxidoreductase [Helianthus annuus]
MVIKRLPNNPLLLLINFFKTCVVVFNDEDDVATYTVRTFDDPRMLNKTLYLRPQENILTHNQLV